jgi:hypothetical protein
MNSQDHQRLATGRRGERTRGTVQDDGLGAGSSAPASAHLGLVDASSASAIPGSMNSAVIQ